MKDYFPEKTLQHKLILGKFKKAAIQDDCNSFWRIWGEISEHGIIDKAMNFIKGSDCGKSIRLSFLEAWLKSSEGLRSECDDDIVLINALWSLLPPYCGPAVQLYRGETFWNRKRRTYGISWTSNRMVAASFMHNNTQMNNTGAVLLETIAPSSAVICAPCLLSEYRNEFEYIVDRRLLKEVKVIEKVCI